MTNITNELSQEHQNILAVINLVQEECSRIEGGQEINNDFFTKVVGFIRNYADGYHHAKEENILFKAMLDSSDCMHCNPIPVMLHEHEDGRHYVAGLEAALAEGNKDIILENARGYCDLLENHIYKEDHVLYPMAEQAVSESQKEEVTKLYNAVDVNDYFSGNIGEFIKELSLIGGKP